MNIHLRRLLSFTVAASILSGFALAGCERSPTDAYCDKACDCHECEGSERDRCKQDLTDVQADAQGKGCGADFEAALTCILDNEECTDGLLVPAPCAKPIDGYQTCMEDDGYLGFVYDACVLLGRHTIERYEPCGVQVGASSDLIVECGVEAARRAPCLDACLPGFDCACFADISGAGCEQKNQAYTDCTAACQ